MSDDTRATVLGIDLGTSSVKAVVARLDGSVAGQSRSDYPVRNPRPGWSETGPADWLSATVTAVRAAVAGAGAQPCAVGLSATPLQADSIGKRRGRLSIVGIPIRSDKVKEIPTTWSDLKHPKYKGLMVMPAPAGDPEATRPAFRRTAELAARSGLARLSMGMTADFEVAVEEGATLIRVGTALFGPRPVRRPGTGEPAPAANPAPGSAADPTTAPGADPSSRRSGR